MVRRLHAHALVDAMALRVSAGGASRTRSWSTRTRRRARRDPEYELIDTGVFDEDRYWDIAVDYAKARPTDMLHPVSVAQRRARRRRRSTCCRRSGSATRGLGTARPAARDPRADDGALVGRAPTRSAACRCSRRRRRPSRCSVRTRRTRRGCGDAAGTTPYPKDGINDHVVDGAATVNPERTGTKAALRYRLTVAAGRDRRRVRLRLVGDGDGRRSVRRRVRRCSADRRARGRRVLRRPHPRRGRPPTSAGRCARPSPGMLWGKQFYHYDVAALARRRPGQPPPPTERRAAATPTGAHLDNRDVISMPDTWEYPWYAAWDLAFHCVALAHVDPGVRQAPAVLLLPRVVHAPERPASRVRVVLRRRQPAGARVGGAARVPDRRRARLRRSSSGCSTSCCSTSRGG